MASSINASTSGGGGIITTADATGNLNIQSGGSTVVAVTSAGVAVTGTLSATGASTFTGTGKFATTIGVGNATPSASGSGITFPATQSASSDANTLDDYEEGTWTPILTPATGTITSQSCTGSYVKIGRQVTLAFRALITGGTVTQISQITNFPFTTENTNQQSCGVARETQVVGTLWQAINNGNSTVASLYNYLNSGTCNNAYGWSGSVTYITP